MTNVQFQANAPQEYLHTPLKFVVQIQGSKIDSLLNSSTDQIVQPQPSMTLSEIKELSKHQRFDVTALVKSVGGSRTVANDRNLRKGVHAFCEGGFTAARSQTNEWHFIQDCLRCREMPTVVGLSQGTGAAR